MSDHHPMTMKDIARHFGVSVATVSRALAGNAHISEGRRAAIQAYAREHHFRPNAMAGSLRNQSAYPQRVIGVVVPKLVHEYFPTVLAGIEAVATRFSAEQSADLSLLLPVSLKEELEPWVEGELRKKLGSGLKADFTKKVAGGFSIGPKDGGWFVSMTDDTFSKLLAEYIRPVTRKLLFG